MIRLRFSTGLILLACLTFAVPALSQTYIFGRAGFPGVSISPLLGAGPSPIATGDFNGDGLIDIVVANNNDDTVSVLLGRPDGTFAPSVAYATGPAPSAVAVGDFNGDGNFDIAVTNENCTPEKYGLSCSPGTVSILLGNGDGTFQAPVAYGVGTQPMSAVVADFNGDGKPDLAVSNEMDSTVSILLGNGDGTFQSQVVYATARGPQGLAVGSFTGSGHLDLVIACAGGISVLPGNGNGTFQSHIDSTGSGSSLAMGDFNHDGKLDLATVEGSFPFSSVQVFLGNGNGTFTLNATFPGGSGIAAADLNGDGNIDLMIPAESQINDAAAGVVVMLGNGDGTFQSAVEYAVASGTDGPPVGVVLADVNGDGKLDMVILPPPLESDLLTVLLGFGDGTFVGQTYYYSGATSPVSADFNGDGKPDIAVSTSTGVNVFLGNGDGTFQPAINTSITQVPNGPIVAADFNGDGIVDVATVSTNCVNSTCQPGYAVVLLGNGDGTFQTPQQYLVGLNPGSLVTGDFNNDGHPDLAVANFSAQSVSILLNNGNGTFQAHVDYPLPADPSAIATGDFKGNGNLDLAVADYGQLSVSVLLGNGDGTFQPYVDYTLPAAAESVAVGDANGDGKPDLVVTTQLPSVCVLLGNGDGTFQPAVQTYAGGLSFPFPTLDDFNADGKLDVFLNPSYGYAGAILLGNGDATFQQPMYVLLEGGGYQAPGPVAIQDFNGDGSPDLVGVNNNSLTVMLSAGFKSISPSSLNFGSQGVGTTSNPQTITVSNASNVKINVASISPSGSFGESNNCGSSLNIGSNCTVNVTFSPTVMGQQNGSITVTDSTRISPLAIPLSGTGVNGPFISIYPARQNFSPQTLGSSSSPSAIMVVNTGNAPLGITSIGITGTNGADFSQTNTCGSSLGVGGSCTVHVTFTPTAAGSRMASLSISDTAPGSPQSATLVGTGIGPLPRLSPSSLTFGSQPVGTTSGGQIATLSNLGSAALNISSISASGDFAQTNTCGTSLPAGGSNCQITVTFSPTVAGTRTGTVTIADNAAGSPQTVSLSGVATAAPDYAIGPAPGQPASQTVSAGQSAKFSLMVTPSGSFTGTVNLGCSIKPVVSPAPTCSLPSSVQISGSSGQSVTVTIGTTAAVTTGTISHVTFPSGWIPMAWAGMLFPFACFWLRNRRRLPVLAPIIVLAIALWVGCGGSSSSPSSPQTTPGTPAGTYTATVSATSGNLSHNMMLTVTVQ